MKQEIIEKISKYFKLTDFEAEEIYDDIFSGIIHGVKYDNIAVISNLGEFIIKINSGDSAQKRSVEFLPVSSFEEDINRRSFEDSRTFEPAEFISPVSGSIFETDPAHEKDEDAPEKKPIEAKDIRLFEEKPAVEKMHSESTIEEDRSAVEEDIRKKREGILSKIISPKEQKVIPEDSPVSGDTTVFPKISAPDFITEKEKFISEEETLSSISGSENANMSDLNAGIDNNIEKAEELAGIEENKAASFSDFFTEVNEKEKSVKDSFIKTTIPPVENVIPPAAVELHNQITGDQSKSFNYQSSVSEPVLKDSDGSGAVTENGSRDNNKVSDKSYYIWYKDSEPNTIDTQTMSYEYELLYQATKEAEYKSKLKIYVSTFILFFSVVLVLLIFSPVIYKYFFTPRETDQNTEQVQEGPSGLIESTTPNNENQASVNTLKDSNQNTANVTAPTDSGVKNNTNLTQQEQPKQEQPKQEEQKKIQQPVEPNTIAGVTKSSTGWKDDVNGVVYIQMENGKFTIQESAWDSDAKANKRLSVVEAKVPGLKGSVLKVDLGSKGIWYRAMFGEFTTLQEAKSKADELRAAKNK